jgi:hypothetical protein
MKFLIWKRDIFCKFKEIKGLCGGEHSFAKPASLQIDAGIAKNSRFRTETSKIPYTLIALTMKGAKLVNLVQKPPRGNCGPAK